MMRNIKKEAAHAASFFMSSDRYSIKYTFVPTGEVSDSNSLFLQISLYKELLCMAAAGSNFNCRGHNS